MEMTIFEKLELVFKYLTSSFLSINIFILSLLLFLFTLFNIKKNNHIVKIASSILIIAFLIGIVINYKSYAISSIDAFIKGILSYIYFPSMSVYFFIMLFVTLDFIITIFVNKIPKPKKIINSIVLSFLYFCFMAVVSLTVTEKLDLSSTVSLYTNDTLLSFIQISNLVFSFWLEYTVLYYFYKFLEKKFD